MGEKKQTKKKSGTLNRHFYTKTWKSNRHNVLSQEEVEHRIYNDLPLDDILDKAINTYKRTGKHKKTNSKPPGRPKNNEDENM